MIKNKMIKKIISTLLAATMLFSMGTTVFANEGVERVCISETTFEEVTDIKGLISLALDQSAQNPALFSNRSIGDSDNQIHVEQILSERKFADGTKEYEKVETGLIVLDKDLVAIPKEVLVSGMFNDTAYSGLASVTVRLYITSKDHGDGVQAQWKHRIDKSVATINYTGASDYRPIVCELMHRPDDYTTDEYKTFVFREATSQSFSLLSSNRTYYTAYSSAINLFAQAVVTLKDGVEFSAIAGVPSDAWIPQQ